MSGQPWEGRTEVHRGAPLHRAVQLGRIEMVRILVRFGVDVNSPRVSADGSYRWTALHVAVWTNQAFMIKLLLDLGAAYSICASWSGAYGVSLTPLEWARKGGLQEIASMLQEFAASADFAMKDIPLKATYERELRAAEKIQAQLTENALRSIQIDDEMATLKREKVSLADKSASLRSKKAYRNAVQIARLRDKVDGFQSFSSTLKDMVAPPSSTKAEDLMRCSQCEETATMVFSCEVCDSWVCECCKDVLEACPSCSIDFVARPPRRNRGIEKVLKRQ